MSRTPLVLRWKELSAAELRTYLSGPESLVLQVPETWCYRILRPAPPGGWSGKLRGQLREALFPQGLDQLHWDEAVLEDGSWSMCALPKDRYARMVNKVGNALRPGRRDWRICPEGADPESITAFPNLAPPENRGRRWPWKRIRRWAVWAGPILLVLLSGGLLAHRLSIRWREAEAQQAQARRDVEALKASLAQVRSARQALGHATGVAGADPRWVQDLDALTRLLPEDTHLIEWRWSEDLIQVEIITPNPELIRSILASSPEFKDVRFKGNLERKGELSRLTLEFAPKVAA